MFKTVLVFFFILENFLSYHNKTPSLSITKVIFRGFGCKIQINTLTRFWTTNSVKYENVILVPSSATPPAWNSRQGKQRSENKAFVFFIYLELSNKNYTAI